MKLLIRLSLLCIALICFSNIGSTQKKSKKKTSIAVSAKKKKLTKKISSQKKKVKNKNTQKKYPKKKVIKANDSNYDLVTPSIASKEIVQFSNRIDSVPEKVVTIVSAFKPQLKNIAKIGFLNATAQVDTNTVSLKYQVPSQNLSFQYQPIALVPRALKKDSVRFDRQSSNLKIGFGNYFSQFLQAQTSLKDNMDQIHHISLKNESITGNHPIQKWNSLGLIYLGSLKLNNLKTLHTQFYFDQSNRYRYGLVPDTTMLPLSNFEQKFSNIGVNLKFLNQPKLNSIFHYAPILKIDHGNLNNQARDLNIQFFSPMYFSFKNNITLNIDFSYQLNHYTTLNRASKDNYFIQLDPSIELNRKHLVLKMGVRPTLANGSFSLYPKFEIIKQLKDTNYTIHAGWKTTLTNQLLSQLMGQNHWIVAPNELPISTNESKYFQVDMNVHKRLNYGFNIALNDYRAIPFFNQSYLQNNVIEEGLKFDVLFEKRAIAIELNGHLRYQLSDKLLWKNQFKYLQFNLIRENEQAWGVLPFELNTQFNWTYSKNLNFDASGQLWTGSKTSAGLGRAYQLNNTFVLNAGLQYVISNKWIFWVKGENLLDQQYQRWANYPSLGVQFIAGIQYKFSKK